MKKNNLLLVASLGLLLASCKSGPKKTPGGIDYTVEKSGNGAKLKIGDTILVHFTSYLNDSMIMSTRQHSSNAVPIVITKSNDKYDLMDGFAQLTEGDSALFIMPVDSMKEKPPFVKPGDKFKVGFYVESVYSAAKQTAKDEKAIKEYVEKNKLKATKTEKGVYVAVTQEGTGEKPKNGDTVSMNYTGKLLDGKTFDSNTDSTIHPGMPLQPFVFALGEGRVIPGWDDAILQLKKGSKATIVIPSAMGYGLRGGGPIIGPNSVLVFNVELMDVKAPVAAPPAPVVTPAAPAKKK